MNTNSQSRVANHEVLRRPHRGSPAPQGPALRGDLGTGEGGSKQVYPLMFGIFGLRALGCLGILGLKF